MYLLGLCRPSNKRMRSIRFYRQQNLLFRIHQLSRFSQTVLVQYHLLIDRQDYLNEPLINEISHFQFSVRFLQCLFWPSFNQIFQFIKIIIILQNLPISVHYPDVDKCSNPSEQLVRHESQILMATDMNFQLLNSTVLTFSISNNLIWNNFSKFVLFLLFIFA